MSNKQRSVEETECNHVWKHLKETGYFVSESPEKWYQTPDRWQIHQFYCEKCLAETTRKLKHSNYD